MSSRSWAALALLLAAIAAERCGYTAVQSTLTVFLYQGRVSFGMNPALPLQLFYLLYYVAHFAGAGLALAAPPRVVAAIGAGVSALGAFALLAGAPAVLAMFMLAIGGGLFRPNAFYAAAEILVDAEPAPSSRRFASVAAFMVIAIGATHVAAKIAQAAMRLSAETRDPVEGFGFGFGGALGVLAALFAGGAFFLGSAPANAAAQGAPAAPKNSDVVFGPLVLIGTAFACLSLADEHARPDPSLLQWIRASWIHSIGSILVVLLTIASAALCIVLATQRSALPLTKILGPGLLVWGLGMAVAAFASRTFGSMNTWAVALVLIAAGEAVAAPLALAYAAVVWRGRKAVMVLAGWMALTHLTTVTLGFTFRGRRFGFEPLVFGGLAALVAIGIGIHVLVAADRVHQKLAAGDPQRTA